MTLTRFAVVKVETTEEWLTSDGEYSVAEGWQAVESDLIQNMYANRRYYGSDPNIKLSWEDWEPEQAVESDLIQKRRESDD